MSYSLTNLGTLPGGSFSQANCINSTGSVVGGWAVDSGGKAQPVYWDGSNTIHQLSSLGSGSALGTPTEGVYGCSPDGTVLVGTSFVGIKPFPVAWVSGVITTLPSGGVGGVASGISSNGLRIVGYTTNAAVWNSGVLTTLPMPVGCVLSTAVCISSDGTVIGGYASLADGTQVAVIWTNPSSWIATICARLHSGTNFSSQINGISPDGSVLVGFGQLVAFQSEAAYWTSSGTVVTALAGPIGGTPSDLQAADATGTGLVGVGTDSEPALWISGTGQHLPTGGGGSGNALAVTPDRSIIVGVEAGFAAKWAATVSSFFATLADLFFAPTQSFVDFSDPANRRKFIYVNGGAQNLQPDGSGPFAVTPQVFLSLQGSDVPTNFGNQGRGGAFVRAGPAPTDGASDPPPVTTSSVSAASTTPFSAVLGDRWSGNIYAFSPAALTDAGARRIWIRRWRALPGDTTSSITFSYLNVEFETGAGVPPTHNPQVRLRWSDDDGRTWTGYRILPVGQTGQTSFNVKFNRLGSTSRFSASTRIFELSSTAQFKVAIISAEVMTK
jgi:uncharacterized membrane protein